MSSAVLPQYKCTVDQVTSGDDLVLLVDMNFDDLFKKIRARLQGVDTPDAYRIGRDTPAGEVRDYVRTVTRGNQCTISVHSQGRGGWKVTLVVHTNDGDINLNKYLQDQGYVYSKEGKHEKANEKKG